MLGEGGGATSRADGQAIDGTGSSDSYEVTGLPGWSPHRTDRQVLDQDTAPKVEPGRASRGSDRCWWGPGIINGIARGGGKGQRAGEKQHQGWKDQQLGDHGALQGPTAALGA